MASTQKTVEEGSIERAAEHFEAFMEALGLPPESSEHLEDTPERVAKAYMNELFGGRQENPRQHLKTTFSNGSGSADDSGLVIVDNIQVQSLCAHHWLPFTGRAHVGYIPEGRIVGLSKLARVVNGYARRPQVQEKLTNEIADAVYEELDPLAVIVVLEAEHFCMSLRGIEEPHSTTRTSALRGEAHPFDGEAHIKQEFMQLIDNGGK